MTHLLLGAGPGKAAAAAPSTPVAGYTAWYDASQEAYSNNDPVDSWTDRSANALTVSNTLTLRPTFKTNIINGKPVIRFDGSSQFLGSSGDALGTAITPSAYTIFVVFNAAAISTANGSTWDNPALVSDTGGDEYFSINLKSTPAIFAYNWDTNDDNVSKSISTGTNYIVQTRHESGNLYVSLNAGSESSVASGDTGDIANKLYVGVGNSIRFFQGDIAEIIIYNTALSTSDIALNYSYLNGKYAVY